MDFWWKGHWWRGGGFHPCSTWHLSRFLYHRPWYPGTVLGTGVGKHSVVSFFSKPFPVIVDREQEASPSVSALRGPSGIGANLNATSHFFRLMKKYKNRLALLLKHVQLLLLCFKWMLKFLLWFSILSFFWNRWNDLRTDVVCTCCLDAKCLVAY